jgi:hypothetical protein
LGSNRRYQRSLEGSSCLFIGSLLFTTMFYYAFENQYQYWITMIIMPPLMTWAEVHTRPSSSLSPLLSLLAHVVSPRAFPSSHFQLLMLIIHRSFDCFPFISLSIAYAYNPSLLRLFSPSHFYFSSHTSTHTGHLSAHHGHPFPHGTRYCLLQLYRSPSYPC